VITKDMLKTILSNHEKWFANSNWEAPGRANLSGANLSGANLNGVNLSYALLNGVNLSGANLKSANLSGASMFEVDLSGANLSGANLNGASLLRAHLRKANLIKADLSGAYLIGADLKEADLSKADLVGADLREGDLSGTSLLEANLKKADLRESHLKKAIVWFCNMPQTIFELKSNSLPYIPSFVSAIGLSELTFIESTHSLVELRKALKEEGLRKQEREVTYAIKKTQRQKLLYDEKSSLSNIIEGLFNQIFFELTCAYGMKPGRCFIILIALIFFFTIPYSRALSTEGEDGIWVVWISDRVRKDLGRDRPVRLFGSGISTIKWGFYFSVLSAFSIGWREINVGNWIARMQWREYTLRATGWVRFVSGLQSLTSVYLIALLVLSYFGRPFEAI
jgi:hypothetical protein